MYLIWKINLYVHVRHVRFVRHMIVLVWHLGIYGIISHSELRLPLKEQNHFRSSIFAWNWSSEMLLLFLHPNFYFYFCMDILYFGLIVRVLVILCWVYCVLVKYTSRNSSVFAVERSECVTRRCKRWALNSTAHICSDI